VWQETNLPRLLLNSVIVTASSTLLVLLFSSLAAFGLVQHSFVGARIVLLALLAGIMLPPAAIIVPLYSEIHSFGLLNNYLGLIGPYTALGLSVGILFFYNAFSAIPRHVRAGRSTGSAVGDLPPDLPAAQPARDRDGRSCRCSLLERVPHRTARDDQGEHGDGAARVHHLRGPLPASFEKQFATRAADDPGAPGLRPLPAAVRVRGLTSGAIKG
jgi:hypothetical protein